MTPSYQPRKPFGPRTVASGNRNSASAASKGTYCSKGTWLSSIAYQSAASCWISGSVSGAGSGMVSHPFKVKGSKSNLASQRGRCVIEDLTHPTLLVPSPLAGEGEPGFGANSRLTWIRPLSPTLPRQGREFSELTSSKKAVMEGNLPVFHRPGIADIEAAHAGIHASLEADSAIFAVIVLGEGERFDVDISNHVHVVVEEYLEGSATPNGDRRGLRQTVEECDQHRVF